MRTVKLHTRTDAAGMLHLDLPADQPNVEIDAEVTMRPAPVREKRAPNSWDRPFFEHFLGDRRPTRRSQNPPAQTKPVQDNDNG